MAKKSQLLRIQNKDFVPFNTEDFDRVGVGEIIEVTWSKPRNPAFHRKVMALFKFVHDQMPDLSPIEYAGNIITPMADFNETRKWLTVNAGFFNVYGFPDGSVRIEAKSLSYAKMDEEEFKRVFSALIDVALELIPHINSRKQIEWSVNEILRFL